jgi:high affinity Mn2+ porin
MRFLKRVCLRILVTALMNVTACISFAAEESSGPVTTTSAHDETASPPHAGAGTTLLSAMESLPSWFPKVLGMQFNGVYQNMPAFKSPYQGQNSLTTSNGEGHDFTQTYGVYLGSQLAPTLQTYLDFEMFRGNGISDGTGLAGYVNGDVNKSGSSNLPKTPYVARLYLRYFLPLSSETEKMERGMDQLSIEQPVSRWEIKIGKIALTDDFDQNLYANDNRTQFLNCDFLYNTTWDYAADTRGYSYGFTTALVKPQWRLAFGVYMEPNRANGNNFDYFNMSELGYNLELTLKPNNTGTVVRLLSYFNESRMGSYDAALALGRATSSVPDVSLVDKSGGTKYGFGLNFEQPLADDGETGIFGRLGWDDGSHESWAYTEADQHGSLGVQVNGVHWGRKEDCFGLAYGVNGLSTPHKEYLEAGGSGFMLGDGRLNYGLEQVLEAYYRVQIGSYLQVSPDFQFIQNPGYNKDRGPVEVYGLRARLKI